MPITYKLRDRGTAKVPGGDLISGSFYEAEMMPTTVPDIGFIEVIPGTEGTKRDGVTGAIVHWKGVSNKQDTFMSDAMIELFGPRESQDTLVPPPGMDTTPAAAPVATPTRKPAARRTPAPPAPVAAPVFLPPTSSNRVRKATARYQ